ncbi:D-alanyl-D-alanine carboxypeptidase [Mesobacillus persicus]|uniref:D-alanyl-D-alanine carboxypeptidase n=1 Tax=Mesobacillus persicus TaxID=930146 RepID=A0A1H8KMU0_9BACI|nr:D-alanyl-D-alanine carboxypeptidase family protein [Mesobacillus persicus]SEN94262.1 D-alanyl-D-alanine carboxypeptidase [Mesobacillus persicus]
MKRMIIAFIIHFLLLMFVSSNVLAQDERPNIKCEAYIVMEEGSGRVLYEKNADKLMYPASLTKVATAIYAIENGNLEDMVTVSERARNADGTRVYLEVGEKVPLKKLVQGLLINSGNDAGVAIAEHIDGSVENYANHLNLYLKEIGLEDTHFKNPHGLFDPDHVTTAKDLAKITQYAMKNAEFRTIFGTEELKWDGQAWDTTLFTHHKLMRERPYEGVTGGKTGFVDEAGNTLITTANRDGMSVIVVVLKGPSSTIAYSDTVELLDSAFTQYKLIEIPEGKEYVQNDFTYITNNTYAFPIADGEKMYENITEDGTLEITIGNQDFIATIPILNDSVEVSQSLPTVKASQSQPEEAETSTKMINIIIGLILALTVTCVVFIKRKRGDGSSAS